MCEKWLINSAPDYRADLLRVIPELTDDDGRQVDLLALELMSADRSLLGFHAEGSELLEKPFRHSFDVFEVSDIQMRSIFKRFASRILLTRSMRL